eukprot:SAG11_NODE_2555_length_3224_cov_2.896640_5_plen_115_part_00
MFHMIRPRLLHLHQVLEAEQVEKRTGRAKYSAEIAQTIATGDIIRITYLESMTKKEVTSFQGMVIGKYGRGECTSNRAILDNDLFPCILWKKIANGHSFQRDALSITIQYYDLS